MQRQQVSRTSSSDESSLSRVLIHSGHQTSEHTLPLSITPSSLLQSSTRRTTHTQTIQETQALCPSKSIPSFAETQLLSVYYPSLDPKNPSKDDKCVFVEQQNRQPVRCRIAYDPFASTKSTQTSPPSTPLSTYASTLIIDRNHNNKPTYNQHLKIHSGSQNLSNNLDDQHALPNELIEETKHSYEEYIVQLNDKQKRTSSSSSSSVTTVIAQNGEVDSDHTSHLSFDPVNTQSSSTNTSITNHENQRISSWPPAPDDILLPIDVQYENDQQRPSSRVQFAEQLINVIPPSATNSLSEESTSLPPAIIPRTNIKEKNIPITVESQPVHDQLQRFDYRPVNQSKWIKTQLDNSESQMNTTNSRVETLRSIFEQQTSHSSDSSTVTSPINHVRRTEPEEKPSKHGDEIRFRVKDVNASFVHHAEPAKVVQHTIIPSVSTKQEEQSTKPFKLDQIRQITGKPIKNLDDIGHYLQDGHTWQWNEVFWLSLTTSQRDQLRDLEHHSYSRRNSTDHSLIQNNSESSSSLASSSNDTKRVKPTINVTGAGAWQQHKSHASSFGMTKYTETSTLHESRPTVSVLSSVPSSTTTLSNGSQESLVSSVNQQQILKSNKRTDSQLTIIESGYGSADDQQRFRPTSSTIVEEPSVHPTSPKSSKQLPLDPLSYEQFIYEYLSTHSRHSRSHDGTLILSIHGQQISVPDIRSSSSDGDLTPTKNIYADAVDNDLLPFETESNELVIFIYGEIVVLPADRWHVYHEKYKNASWVRKLKRVNRNIPQQLIPTIEQWLADHAVFSLELIVDGVNIPLIGGFDFRRSQTNSWHEILNYLIRIGYVSYDADQQLIHIANSELDARRLLVSPLSERLAQHLRSLNHIHFHNENGSLIITEDFVIPKEYIQDLHVKSKQRENLNANDLADRLLELCQTEEDERDQSLILTFENQILRLKTSSNEDHIKILAQWLQQLNQQQLIHINDENDIIIYPNNPNQQICINHEHVETYMERKVQREVINMNDIAHILLLHNYVRYSSGHLFLGNQQILLDTNELTWLQSIIRSIRFNEHTQETEVELYDGQHTQILQISHEYMAPTTDSQVVANYLIQNGNIRYEVNTGNYSYYYISPVEKARSAEHEFLSSHIRSIHADEDNQRIEIEFIYDSTHYLQLPSDWYEQLSQNHFNRSKIINMLLANGSIINEDSFLFNNNIYPLNLSSKQKKDRIDYYVEYINNHNGIHYDNIKNQLILENSSDGSQLYLTQEHTQFIHENQYRRQDMKYLLMRYGQLTQDEYNNWLLSYNNQCIQIPFEDQTSPQVQRNLSQETSHELLFRYHSTIEYMYNHGLITCNKRLKLLRIQCSNQILTIPTEHLRSILNIKIFHSPNDDILPFTSQELSRWLLNQSSQIKASPQGSVQLIYKNKLYTLPMIPSKNHSSEQHETNDSRLQLLFPFNKSLRLIQKTPSTTTLDIQQPNEDNGYAIDPLLMLANYIQRISTIYQDSLGRLVIKLNRDEIVIPRVEATSAIEAINASPNRTGTIIARLIHRIGKVQANESGGLLITIGKNSFQLPKETGNRATEYNLTTQNRHSPLPNRQRTVSPKLPLLQHSKSADTLSVLSTEHPGFTDDQQISYTREVHADTRHSQSARRNDLKSNRPQTSVQLKPRIIIIPDHQTSGSGNHSARFYIQHSCERDAKVDAMSSSRSRSQSTQPQLVTPQHYKNPMLRDAPVYVHKHGDGEVCYDNLAHYLSTKQSNLSSRTVRRMLNFSSRDDYFTYLSKTMSTAHAQQLVQESEGQSSEFSSRFSNIKTRMLDGEINLLQERSRSLGNHYNVQSGTTRSESNLYEEEQQHQEDHYRVSSKSVDRSISSSSLGSEILMANIFPSRRTDRRNAPLSQYV